MANKIYWADRFRYKPEERDKYLKSLIGKKVIVKVAEKKKNIHGAISGFREDGIVNKLEIEQKNQFVVISVTRIDEIYEV